MPAFVSDRRRLDAARRIFEHVATVVDIPISLRLWDGMRVPLGQDAAENGCLSISGPGVLGSPPPPTRDDLYRAAAPQSHGVEAEPAAAN